MANIYSHSILLIATALHEELFISSDDLMTPQFFITFFNVSIHALIYIWKIFIQS